MIALTRTGPQPAPQRAVLLPAAAALGGDNPQFTTRDREPKTDNAADRAIRGGSDKPLSREQKTVLVLLAKEAHAKLSAVDAGLADFNTWRVNEAIAACTRRIREAHNSDFLAIRSRFRNHLGQAALAFDDALNECTADQRIALHKLAEACQQRELRMEYPTAICWKQFKCALKDASAKQIWCLVFTVRNRRKATKAPNTVKAIKGAGRSYELKAPAQFQPKPKAQPQPESGDPF